MRPQFVIDFPGSRCVPLLLLLSLLAGCGNGAYKPLSSTAPALGRSAAQSKRTLFAAVVRAVRDSLEEPIRVDPRPLQGTAESLLSVMPLQLAPAHPEILRRRSAVLGRLGIQQTNALEYEKCLFDNGLAIPPSVAPPPSPEERRERRRKHWLCEPKEQYKAIVVSLPRRSEPPSANPNTHERWRTVRVLIMLTYGFHLWDMTLAWDASGGTWNVIRQQQVYGVLS